ncbi:MAG TPA: hypothetical protein VFV38_15235 [Ktedonobacteraceae bacterium]|nr:hypothetical protein [Ktedonobacteraceae bacterium]
MLEAIGNHYEEQPVVLAEEQQLCATLVSGHYHHTRAHTALDI